MTQEEQSRQSLILLRDSLYRLASTFNVSQQQVNQIAIELRFPAFTRGAYRAIRQVIEQRWGRGVASHIQLRLIEYGKRGGIEQQL